MAAEQDGGVASTILGAILLMLYLLPAIVAWRRRHRNENAIGVLNLFLGWTFLGWVIAMVWAFTDNTRPVVPKASNRKNKPLLKDKTVTRRDPYF